MQPTPTDIMTQAEALLPRLSESPMDPTMQALVNDILYRIQMATQATAVIQGLMQRVRLLEHELEIRIAETANLQATLTESGVEV